MGTPRARFRPRPHRRDVTGAPIKAPRRSADGTAAVPAAMAAATAGPAPEPLRQGPFCGQPPREPSPEPPRPPRSPWGPTPPELGRLLRSLSAPSGRAVPPPPGFSPRLRGAPPGLSRSQPPDTALLALAAALSLGADPPEALPAPFPSRRSAPLSALGLTLLSPTSHEASQLSPSLSSPQSPFSFSLSPPSSPPSPLYKTELCRPFTATGHCRYGARCQFAHGPEELRGLRRHPKYRTQPCSTFQRCGTCPYGSRCHFLHGPAPSTPAEGSTGSPGSPHRLPVFDRFSVSE